MAGYGLGRSSVESWLQTRSLPGPRREIGLTPGVRDQSTKAARIPAHAPAEAVLASPVARASSSGRSWILARDPRFIIKRPGPLTVVASQTVHPPG